MSKALAAVPDELLGLFRLLCAVPAMALIAGLYFPISSAIWAEQYPMYLAPDQTLAARFRKETCV